MRNDFGNNVKEKLPQEQNDITIGSGVGIKQLNIDDYDDDDDDDIGEDLLRLKGIFFTLLIFST